MLPVKPDGSLGPRSDFVQHDGSSIDPERQYEAFAHSVTIDSTNARVYVCDLGMDEILVYSIDHERGHLVGNDDLTVSTRPGHGPRHFAFHPSDKYCYAINELGSTIAAYEYDHSTGRISEMQLVSTLPEGWSGNPVNGGHSRLAGRALRLRVQSRTRFDSDILGRSGNRTSGTERTRAYAR